MNLFCTRCQTAVPFRAFTHTDGRHISICPSGHNAYFAVRNGKGVRIESRDITDPETGHIMAKVGDVITTDCFGWLKRFVKRFSIRFVTV